MLIMENKDFDKLINDLISDHVGKNIKIYEPDDEVEKDEIVIGLIPENLQEIYSANRVVIDELEEYLKTSSKIKSKPDKEDYKTLGISRHKAEILKSYLWFNINNLYFDKGYELTGTAEIAFGVRKGFKIVVWDAGKREREEMQDVKTLTDAIKKFIKKKTEED